MQSKLKQETLAGNGQQLQDASDQFEQQEQSTFESRASGHNSSVEPKHSSRDMKLELIQIYDSATPYQDHLRKHPLPANISVLTHSTSSWCSSSHTGTESSHTKPGESIPVYSVPDMKKKREERIKKREQSTDEYSRLSGKLLPPEGDQVLTVDNICLYDEPTSLSLVPKRREQPFKEGRQRVRMTERDFSKE